MLEINNLKVGYGAVLALKGIDLSVPAGEIVCLIGPNGAGKTTTLKSILGLLPIMEGDIYLQGESLKGLATAQIVARHLRIRHRMLVASCLWPQLGLPEGILPPDELRFGIHAGALETALVQAIRPELVRADRLARFDPTTRERAARAPVLGGLGATGFGWMAQDLHPSGAAGDATLASAELGRSVLDHVAGRLLALVRELRDQPLGELGPGPLGRG